MSLRYAVLGLLARQPSSGYELTRAFDRSLRTSWHASHTQVYPELGKLERAGLVEVVGHGPRRSTTYGLTDAGWDDLRRWLVDAEPDRSQRNESGVRLFLAPLLDPTDRLAVYERDLAHVVDEITSLEQLRRQTEDSPTPEVLAPQIELGIRINTVIRDWLREQIRDTDEPGPHARPTTRTPSNR